MAKFCFFVQSVDGVRFVKSTSEVVQFGDAFGRGGRVGWTRKSYMLVGRVFIERRF